MAELATPMMDVIVDDEDGTFSFRRTNSSSSGGGAAAAAASVTSQTSSIGRRGRWQCLEDVDMEGIDLCSAPVQTSHDEAGTRYMLGFST